MFNLSPAAVTIIIMGLFLSGILGVILWYSNLHGKHPR